MPSGSIYINMKHRSKVRTLTSSLMGLFGANKTVNAHKMYPNECYKYFYFKKSLCDGINLVAKIERTSKKQTAELLMKAGHLYRCPAFLLFWSHIMDFC
jgi:hypothetical protein